VTLEIIPGKCRMVWARWFASQLLMGACVGSAVLAGLDKSVGAQSGLPACPPPDAQEFLVLIRGDSEAERARAAAVLPAESSVLICQYLDEVVVRGGRFASLETANAWASYMNTVEGFESFVLRPATAQPVASSGSDGGTGYRPQRLGSGYAVLVDYRNRPEVADSVAQLVRPVGLAVYQQKPYLLAQFSNDAVIAASTLQRLSDASLPAALVDAQQVVRLTAEVQ